MATVREDVIVSLGVEHSAIERGLRGATGKIQEWGANVTRTIGRVGAAMIAAFAINKSIAAFREMSAEIDKVFDKFDLKRAREQERANEIRKMSKQDIETIAVGDAMLAKLSDKVKIFLARVTGAFFYIAAIVKEFGSAGISNILQNPTGTLDKAIESAEQQYQAILKNAEDAAVAAQKELELKNITISKTAERLELEKAIERTNAEMVKRSREQLQAVRDMNAERQKAKEQKVAEAMGNAGGQYDATLDRIAGMENYANLLEGKGFTQQADNWRRGANKLRAGIGEGMVSKDDRPQQNRILKEIISKVLETTPITVKVKD